MTRGTGDPHQTQTGKALEVMEAAGNRLDCESPRLRVLVTNISFAFIESFSGVNEIWRRSGFRMAKIQCSDVRIDVQTIPHETIDLQVNLVELWGTCRSKFV